MVRRMQTHDGWDFTVRDYVQIEEESELVKHEFDDGQIRAMSGGTVEHARLAAAFIMQLAPQLRGRPCAVYTSNSRVRTGNLITYPDISVGCGRAESDVEDRLAQTNPSVLVEVTSKSSERYDRGKKRLRYQQLPSLREYVIVSHREHAIDVYTRADGGSWPEPVRYGLGQRVRLASIDCEIDVDELYRDPRAS